MARLQEFYREKVVPDLIKKFGYTSTMEAPRITKITLNMGVSEAVSDKKVMDHAVSDLSKIAGQRPVVTKSKKAIAGFKIRDGVPMVVRGAALVETSSGASNSAGSMPNSRRTGSGSTLRKRSRSMPSDTSKPMSRRPLARMRASFCGLRSGVTAE